VTDAEASQVEPESDASQVEPESAEEPDRLPDNPVRPPDPVLEYLVRVVNQIPGLEFGVTLYVGGCILSGLLVGGRSYFDSLRANLVDGSDESEPIREEFREVFEQVAKVYPAEMRPVSEDDEADEGAEPPTVFVHLRETTVHLPGAASVLEPGLWRGRLESVDGWTLGNFGPKRPPSVVDP
jgi:hypothetical protein